MSTKHKTTLTFALALTFGLTLLYCWPLPPTLGDADYSTVLYDRRGELLGATIAGDEQWRFPPVKTLPEKYKTAVMAFEDSRFYLHPGIDPVAIGRALVANVKAGEIVSGGSTITMQVARLLLGNRARTLAQKIREALLAVQLELHFSKEQIFSLYATHAPFGGNTVGLSAANWRYFGHGFDHMTWAEAALFAVLPNNPAAIFPGRNRERLLQRRNALLMRLHQQGQLSELELKLAMLEKLPGEPRALPNRAPHLLVTLRARYPGRHEFHATLERGAQHKVDQLAAVHSRRLAREQVRNLAVLVIDEQRQEVVAYVGNKTQGNYSPAVDIVQRPRSSGSLFKPFLFAAMVQQGLLLPQTLVPDVPSYYRGYSPENYDRDYRGMVRARRALSQSLNVPAVRMLAEYGVANFKQDLQQVGIGSLFRPAQDYGLSLVLGGAETSLWDVTNAFAGLSRSAGGEQRFSQASLVQAEQRPVHDYPIGQGAAWLTLDALLEVNRPGVAAAWREFAGSQNIAWKTGTSYGWRDAWAVGTNGRYTVGVWAGNASGEEGRRLTGTRAAAPLMLDIFGLLPRGKLPEKPYRALKTYRVCRNDGHLAAGGCETEEVFAPRGAHFTKVSPYHRQIHVDAGAGLRVHGRCERIERMRPATAFELPPVAGHYYRRHHPDYRPAPDWRQDCLASLPQVDNVAPMALEYPAEGAGIRIPVELNGSLGRAVFKAQHRRERSTLYWHLDGRFLGRTQALHEQAVAVNAGWHRLVLVDDQGYRLERWFRAL